MEETMFEIIDDKTVPAAGAQATAAVAQYGTPAHLLAVAVQRGASLEELRELMALEREWRRDNAERSYNVAFSAFKAEAVRIVKNRGVSDGPLRGKKYAELYAVINAVTPALSKHGLSASWSITKDEKDWIEVMCSLRHTEGHSESVKMGGPPDAGGAKNAIMARASTVSYLERYTLKAILGLSEQDDDTDGGRGLDELLAHWTEQADRAMTTAELDAVSKQGAEAFTKAKDVAGYAQFGRVVAGHRRALKGSANA